MNEYNIAEIVNDLKKLGVSKGDTLLIRAGVKSIGRLENGAKTFVEALISAVGEDGTIVSLAFTDSSFLKKPDINNAFDVNKKSYAGALPNTMLKFEGALRSRHPMCSYVAIGKNAQHIVEGHDENSMAYEPLRKIIELKGKCVLVGCVKTSPGFTTAHLAEADLGMYKYAIFTRFCRTYYKKQNGGYGLFTRKDAGLCSKSYYKFYAHYVAEGILNTAHVGTAYSILAPADESYNIEYNLLKKDKKFNICDSNTCFMCNVGRWDRVHRWPLFLARYLIRKIRKR